VIAGEVQAHTRAPTGRGPELARPTQPLAVPDSLTGVGEDVIVPAGASTGALSTRAVPPAIVVVPTPGSSLTRAPQWATRRELNASVSPAGLPLPAARTVVARTAGARGKSARAAVRTPARPQSVRIVTRQSVIDHFEHVVPLAIWLALGGALCLALGAGLGAGLAARRAHSQSARLETVSEQALTDPLTGVLNRRGFLDAAERELSRSRRYRRPFVLAYVDVRGLKAVNDSQGHLAGDALLRHAAGLLRDSARADDVVGRIGGDELALLLAEQSTEGAEAVVNRLRSLLPERQGELGLSTQWDLTIGTAAYPRDGLTVEELLATADRRLYQQRGISLR
jgi:diguanylate cyclase (GGDEF)-like protein